MTIVPATPHVLTVDRVSGDLTSHGWMQGAVTSTLTGWMVHTDSPATARPQR